MARFRVKAGMHEQDGQTYQKDEVVETDLNLIKMFPEKFEKLGASEEEQKGTPKRVDGARVETEDQDEEDESKVLGIGKVTKPAPVPATKKPASAVIKK